jgi:hypothetical protein
MTRNQTPTEFFHEHAGYSYDPKTETEAEGRERCARELAKAESFAESVGWSCEWEIDDIDSSEFDDSPEPWALWRARLVDRNGETLDSLGGVDFGRDREPWGDAYARVVFAELASEAMERVECPMRLADGSELAIREACEWVESQGRQHLKPAVSFFDNREAQAVGAEQAETTEDSYDYTAGWYSRLSAPGYLDATDWSGPHASAAEAVLDLWSMHAE